MPAAAKPVRLRRLAADDVDAALDHLATHGGPDVGRRFVAAVERATAAIGRNPNLGSSRFAFELEIPGLRAFPLRQFPYLVFYVEQDAVVDVWRVLHTRRDLPATFAEAADP